MSENLITFTKNGLYCSKADIFIDPWGKAKYAFITHAHSDHAHFGSECYLAHRISVPVLLQRLGYGTKVQSVEYGELIKINGVNFSFHPAGHIPGSSQIRIEYRGEVWVVSGDYKLQDDKLSTPFEPIRCNTFITESTFGLPIFHWTKQAEIMNSINLWWQKNRDAGLNSLLFAYSLGKAQRIIGNIDCNIGKIFAHAAVYAVNESLRPYLSGFPEVKRFSEDTKKEELKGSLIIAPPAAFNTPWNKELTPYSAAVASGWMAIRGIKRRRGIDVGFVLSDHADFSELNQAIDATGAERVFVTHGYTAQFSRWLNEKGIKSFEVQTKSNNESYAIEKGNQSARDPN